MRPTTITLLLFFLDRVYSVHVRESDVTPDGGEPSRHDYYQPSPECYSVRCLRNFRCVALPVHSNGYRRPYCVNAQAVCGSLPTDEERLYKRQFGRSGNFGIDSFGLRGFGNFGLGNNYRGQIPSHCMFHSDCNRHTNNYNDFAFSCCSIEDPYNGYQHRRCVSHPMYAP